MYAPWLILTSTLAAAEPTPAGGQPPEKLVKLLAAPSAKERAQASQELLKLGRAAKVALVAGSRDANPEIASRCRQLLPTASALDLQARLTAFIADAEGKESHDLPGWKGYRAVVGNTPPARKLFVDMITADPPLFEDLAADPKAAAARFAGRAVQLQNQMYGNFDGRSRVQPALGEIAALLFVGSDKKLPIQATATYPVYNLLYQPSAREAVSGRSPNPAFKKLLLHWIQTRVDTNNADMAMHLAVQLDLKECLPLAEKQLANPLATAHSKAAALTALGKLGTKAQLPLAAKFFNDKSVIGSINMNNVEIKTELRDVALAMSIHLSGQKIADYGYDFTARNPGLMFSYYYLGFPDAEKREAARKKWADWEAKQPKAEKK